MMNHPTKLFLLFLFAFLPSFAKEFDYIQHADAIAAKVNRKLIKKYHFYSGGGGGGMVGCVRHTTSYFDYSGPILSKDEIRKMAVDCVETFKKAYNEDKTIRPYLDEFPVTDKIAYVSIFFTDENEDSLFDPHIAVVTVNDGKVAYKTNDPENMYDYKSRIEESYQEALKIVEEGNCQK